MLCWLPFSLTDESIRFKYLYPPPYVFLQVHIEPELWNEFKNHVLNKVRKDTHIKISKSIFKSHWFHLYNYLVSIVQQLILLPCILFPISSPIKKTKTKLTLPLSPEKTPRYVFLSVISELCSVFQRPEYTYRKL